MAIARSNYNGWYKVRYGKKNDAIPSFAILQERMPFQKRAKIGKSYNEPVFLKRSHGVTIRGGTSAGTVYAQNDPISPQSEEATVTGVEITMREQVAIGAVAAAADGNNTSYGSIVDDAIVGLTEAHRFYIEIGMLYGQTSVGTLSSVSGSGTSRAWVLTQKTWAAGLWSQAEGMSLDCFSAPGGTQRNTNAQILVSSVDPDTRTVNVTGNSTDLTACIAADVLVVRQSDGSTGYFAGLDKVITNTGTLHGISAATYSLWKGNTISAADSPCTLGLLHRATTRGVVRGLSGAFTWYVSTYSWQDLVDNENALRRYASDTRREYVQGAEGIAFVGSNGAKMEILAHPMIKCGEAYGISEDEWIRGGESDLVDTIPGTPDDQFFHHVPGYSALEFLNFSSQFLLCRKPARQVKVTNIVPTGAP